MLILAAGSTPWAGAGGPQRRPLPRAALGQQQQRQQQQQRAWRQPAVPARRRPPAPPHALPRGREQQQQLVEGANLQQQRDQQERARSEGPPPQQQQQHRQQHPQQRAPEAPRWLQRAARLAAGSLLFLGAAAAGPAPRAHATALQPPPSAAAMAQPHRSGRAGLDAPLPLAQTAASAGQQQPQQPAQGQQQQKQQQQPEQAAPPPAGGDAGAPGSHGDELLPWEARGVAIFESNRPSVVNVSHVRSMHHFHTLDLARMSVGQGTGFLWDRAGHVVVAAHTVRGASEVKVTLSDQSTATARVVGSDAASDIAVLALALPRTRTEALRPVALGGSAGLRVGQSVWAIGNPWGLDHTLSKGIVSGLGREMGAGLSALKGVIQTDAAINSGNSGGPLLDSQGRAVGVAIALPDAPARAPGVGHAVPIDAVRRIVDQLLAHGRVKRPSMGVVLAPQAVLRGLGAEGVLVLEVPAGSPAAAAGLRATYRDVFGDVVLGDVIVGIDTRPVRSAAELLQALDDKRPGDRVRCDVLRDGKRLSMTVLLGERVPGAVEE
ncbi:protease Do-like chloroplastic [Raphidocelis subcapitata]|uniref:Protease Do-like chloroplastic n=1 Tax=Raphidocelis subcapitata TaxID=307507 RepID=A0A2V0PF29_9CHLO|nr:protease Do-like chloroplastic [Raphidocelis subcapitata]|eukprot:GBF98129.1 protease Do-like chloroplastic [Raphidocelis subcapitata]